MSHETVLRITQNDPALVTLVIARESDTDIDGLGLLIEEGAGLLGLVSLGYELPEERAGLFDPSNRSELGKLGESIASNTALENVTIHGRHLPNAATATRSHRIFFDGIKRNASIHTLELMSIDLSQGLGNELLSAFKDRNHPLRKFILINCDLGMGNEGFFEMALTLSESFKGLKSLNIVACNVDDQSLQTISAAISGYELKELLNLRNNNIGRSGCDVLATLLKDPSSNLRHIGLDQNNIDDSCCIALADALKKNNKLQNLHLDENPQITETGMNAFTEVLCDTTSINATYLSNHTLMKMTCPEGTMSNHLTRLLSVNSRADKRFIAKYKVLQYHRNPNMAPAVEWDLKLLPHLVDWFDECSKTALKSATAPDERKRAFIKELNKRKLSVMYQFVRAMPLMCVPNRSHRGVKRKHAHAV